MSLLRLGGFGGRGDRRVGSEGWIGGLDRRVRFLGSVAFRFES